MSVNQHSMGHAHSWAFFGSGFSKYSELMLLIYRDRGAETERTAPGTTAFQHPSLPTAAPSISLPKAPTSPLIHHSAVHRTHFRPKKTTAGNSLNNQCL